MADDVTNSLLIALPKEITLLISIYSLSIDQILDNFDDQDTIESLLTLRRSFCMLSTSEGLIGFRSLFYYSDFTNSLDIHVSGGVDCDISNEGRRVKYYCFDRFSIKKKNFLACYDENLSLPSLESFFKKAESLETQSLGTQSLEAQTLGAQSLEAQTPEAQSLELQSLGAQGLETCARGSLLPASASKYLKEYLFDIRSVFILVKDYLCVFLASDREIIRIGRELTRKFLRGTYLECNVPGANVPGANVAFPPNHTILLSNYLRMNMLHLEIISLDKDQRCSGNIEKDLLKKVVQDNEAHLSKLLEVIDFMV